MKSKLDVAESNFTLISICITHRETGEEHINNVLFVAGLSGGEFSALVLITHQLSVQKPQIFPLCTEVNFQNLESQVGVQTQGSLNQRVRQLHSRAPDGKTRGAPRSG